MRCDMCSAYSELFSYTVNSIKTARYLLSKENIPAATYILDSALGAIVQLEELARKEIVPGD